MTPPVQDPGRSKALSVIKADVLSTHIDDKKAVDEACKRVGFWYWCNGRKKGRLSEVYCLCVKNAELIDRLKEDEYVKLDEGKGVRKGVGKRVTFNERGMCSINGEEWVVYYVGKFVLGFSKPVPEVETETAVEKRVRKETTAKKKDEIRAAQWKARQLEGPGEAEGSGGRNRARKERNWNGRNDAERWKRKNVDEADERAGPGVVKRNRKTQIGKRNRNERKRKERATGWKRKEVESSDEGGGGPGHGASAGGSVPARKRQRTERRGGERIDIWKSRNTDVGKDQDAGRAPGAQASRRRKTKRNEGLSVGKEWKVKSVESGSEQEDVPIGQSTGRQRDRNRKDQAVKDVDSGTESDEETEKGGQGKDSEWKRGKDGPKIGLKATERGPVTKRNVANSKASGLLSAAKGKTAVLKGNVQPKVVARKGTATAKGKSAGGAMKEVAVKDADESFGAEDPNEDSTSSDKILAAFGKEKRGAGGQTLKYSEGLRQTAFKGLGASPKAALDPPSKSSLVGPAQKHRGETRGRLEFQNQCYDDFPLRPGLATGSQIAEIDGTKGAAGALTGEQLRRGERGGESSGGRPADSPDWVNFF